MALQIILGLIFIPMALFNLIAPLVIYRKQQLPARIQFEKVDEIEFLEGRSGTFNDLDRQIKALGLDYIGSSALPDTHNIAYFSLYANDQDNTIGMLITMENKVNSFTYAEFSQLYSDGTMLDVSNASTVPAYPRMPLKIAIRFPDIYDLCELYDILLKVKASLKKPSEPINYENEFGFSKLEEFMARESDELVNIGYLKNEVNAESKRNLTLKGAFLMTWKSVFPGRKVLDKLDQSYSQKLLKNA